ncbi:hypothetical protein FNV43_RR20658 [Rhamnella rubrinervis]|uniref:Protein DETOXIFICATION n=1 Tax=Rhamnella rubrinervis TaxID=2594499 RepID=A0A8K0E6X8_9ROSA|nr:hypothetical protein FNV43_RR20658 [Rhamnella rubrinervis]
MKQAIRTVYTDKEREYISDFERCRLRNSATQNKQVEDMPLSVFFRDARFVFKLDSLGKEILHIAVPAALAVAADPIASLIDTAFIGHTDKERVDKSENLEKSNTDFKSRDINQVDDNEKGEAKLKSENLDTIKQNEEDNLEKGSSQNRRNINAEHDYNKLEVTVGNNAERDATKHEMLQKLPSVNSSNKMNDAAAKISKRTRRHIASASTALIFGTILCLLQAIFLMFGAKTLLGVMGVKPGSPMLAPARKYLVTRSFGGPAVPLTLAMQGIFRGFKDTTTPLYVIRSFLLARVIAVTFCVTLAASLAARLGSTPMAAFLTCLQVWLTSSLLAHGLAVSVQAILACAFTEKDYKKVSAAATRILQMSFIPGIVLALLVGVGLYFGAGIFSRDVNVLHLIKMGLPVLVAIASIVSLFLLSKSEGFMGIWIALTIYMGLRTFVGAWRMGTGTGPWRFLRVPFTT